MPHRTRRQGEKRIFKPKMPNLSEKQIDFMMAHLTEKEFQSLQKIAEHYLGKTEIEMITRHPPEKLLGGSLEEFSTADHPCEIVLGSMLQKQMHEDHFVEYHMGGGLYDTMKNLLRTAFNLGASNIEGYEWVVPLFRSISRTEYSPPPRHARNNMDIVKAAYDLKHRKEMLHGMQLDDSLSDERIAVYISKDGTVNIGVRGTKPTNWSDLTSDLQIAWSGEPEDMGLLEKLQEIEEKYPQNPKTISAHSLGSSQVQHLLFQEPALFEDYTEFTLANPGNSPFFENDSIENMIADKRVTLLLHPGDILSSQVISQLPSERENVFYGMDTGNPLEAHSLE